LLRPAKPPRLVSTAETNLSEIQQHRSSIITFNKRWNFSYLPGSKLLTISKLHFFNMSYNNEIVGDEKARMNQYSVLK